MTTPFCRLLLHCHFRLKNIPHYSVLIFSVSPCQRNKHFRRGFHRFEAFFAFLNARKLDTAHHCARPNFRAAKKRKMPRTGRKIYRNACYAGYVFPVSCPPPPSPHFPSFWTLPAPFSPGFWSPSLSPGSLLVSSLVFRWDFWWWRIRGWRLDLGIMSCCLLRQAVSAGAIKNKTASGSKLYELDRAVLKVPTVFWSVLWNKRIPISPFPC